MVFRNFDGRIFLKMGTQTQNRPNYPARLFFFSLDFFQTERLKVMNNTPMKFTMNTPGLAEAGENKRPLSKFTTIGMKTGLPSIFRNVIPWLLVTCMVATGCALIQSKKDIDQSLESTVIVGRVFAESSGNGPIIVAARSRGEGHPIAHYSVLHESGEYELMVAPGKYDVFAYRDMNSNLIYEVGEPAGHYGDAGSLRVPAVGVVFDVDITIPEGGRTPVILPGTAIAQSRPQKLYSRQAGDITTLDDERFAEENGIKGFWQPISFFRELGGNIYFL